MCRRAHDIKTGRDATGEDDIAYGVGVWITLVFGI
jgi:hypothetical protein